MLVALGAARRGSGRSDALEWVFALAAFVAHLQWMVHSPFTSWPPYMPGSKSATDIRHRSEYYDTHPLVFAIYLGLLVRRLPRRAVQGPLPARPPSVVVRDMRDNLQTAPATLQLV